MNLKQKKYAFDFRYKKLNVFGFFYPTLLFELSGKEARKYKRGIRSVFRQAAKDGNGPDAVGRIVKVYTESERSILTSLHMTVAEPLGYVRVII